MGDRVVTEVRFEGHLDALEDKASGRRIAVGETVVDFRGDPAVVTGWRRGGHPGSSGRVFVRVDGSSREYFPSVFGLRVVPLD